MYYLQNAEKNNFVLNKIAQIYEKRQDYKSAVKYQQNELRRSYEYDQFNDKKSLKILKKLQRENPLDPKINFYLSIKYFLMDDFAKAISYMNINAHNKEIYNPLVREMLDVELVEIDNKQKLKFSKNQISEKVNEYLIHCQRRILMLSLNYQVLSKLGHCLLI